MKKRKEKKGLRKGHRSIKLQRLKEQPSQIVCVTIFFSTWLSSHVSFFIITDPDRLVRLAVLLWLTLKERFYRPCSLIRNSATRCCQSGGANHDRIHGNAVCHHLQRSDLGLKKLFWRQLQSPRSCVCETCDSRQAGELVATSRLIHALSLSSRNRAEGRMKIGPFCKNRQFSAAKIS